MWLISIFITLFYAAGILARRSRPYEPPFYTNSKHITELNAETFHDFVYGSNYTTIVEFYAPWCGYCKQLRPEYEKASRGANQFAQFAAVNCDEEKNKQFCSAQNIKGFPTLLTYRPPKTFRPHKQRKQQFAIQTYEKERSSKGIINAMRGTIKSYTKKLTMKNLSKFLDISESDIPKVLLLTNKRQVSTLYKTLAIDFLNVMEFSYLFLDDLASVKELISEIDEFSELPVLLVLHPTHGLSIYEGDINKDDISEFLLPYGKPVEGKFSERQKVLQGIKSGKYKSFAHYNKKKAKKVLKNLKDEL